jgi:Skp family chaperone for outer membrane proteins
MINQQAMKKKILCLMIASLSLFACPFQMNAATSSPVAVNTEVDALPVIPPAMEKKMDELKKKYQGKFSPKENKQENSSKAKAGRHNGVYYISGTALVLIIILLILLL